MSMHGYTLLRVWRVFFLEFLPRLLPLTHTAHSLLADHGISVQVSNDMLDLQVPVWIRDLAFVPKSDGTKIITASAHRHVCIGAGSFAKLASICTGV